MRHFVFIELPREPFLPSDSCISIALDHIYQTPTDLICRWRIQRALYTRASTGWSGCAGISWRDLFLRCPTCRPNKLKGINLSQALTLEDLDDVKPIYISGVTINKWRRTSSLREPDYELLIMSPNGIERLDRPSAEPEFDGKLMPMDIYLSDAMATSAAAVDHHMGARETDDASFRDLKVMLGVAMGTAVVADERHEGKRNCCIQVTKRLCIIKHYTQPKYFSKCVDASTSFNQSSSMGSFLVAWRLRTQLLTARDLGSTWLHISLVLKMANEIGECFNTF